MGIRIRDFFDESTFTFKDLELFKEVVDYVSNETEAYSNSFSVYYDNTSPSIENNLDRIRKKKYIKTERSELILKSASSETIDSALAA